MTLTKHTIPKTYTRAGYAASGEAPRSMLLGAYCSRGCGLTRRSMTYLHRVRSLNLAFGT
eukprot:3885030-Amphidinium_carterae.3